MIPSQNPGWKYREQQVYGASPLQRLLMVYDAAILACNRRDLARTTEALGVLRHALDFDKAPIAFDLFLLYQYCADQARAGEFDEAARVLRELAQAWIQVLVAEVDAKRMNAAPQEPRMMSAVVG